MIIKYSEDIYPREVLIKTAYHFLDRAYIHVGKENDEFVVTITPKEGEEPVSSGEFDNEMLAQAARYVVAVRTKNIREITLGRAMASTIIEENDLQEDDEDVSNVDDILKDWFDNEQD